MKSCLSIHNGTPQGTGWVAVTAPICWALCLLSLGSTCSPSWEGRIFREKVKPVLIDIISQTPRLSKNGIVHKMMIPITELSIGGEIRDRRISSCRPWCFTERIGEPNRWWIITGQIRISHWWIATVLLKRKNSHQINKPFIYKQPQHQTEKNTRDKVMSFLMTDFSSHSKKDSGVKWSIWAFIIPQD